MTYDLERIECLVPNLSRYGYTISTKISVSSRFIFRGVAQSGSALAWGVSGRWFKSSRPDQCLQGVLIGFNCFMNEFLGPKPPQCLFKRNQVAVLACPVVSMSPIFFKLPKSSRNVL
jgi:hypothetical protein